MTFLYFHNTATKLFSCFAFQDNEMITRSMSWSPRKIYFKCESKGSNPKRRCDSIKGIKGFTSLFKGQEIQFACQL